MASIHYPVNATLLLLLLLRLENTIANLVPVCESISGTTSYYGESFSSCYYRFPGSFTYSNGKMKCQEYGMHIVETVAAAEQSWLASKIRVQYWLGLKQVSGVWYWQPSGVVLPHTDSRWVTGQVNGNRAFQSTVTKMAPVGSTSSYTLVCEKNIGIATVSSDIPTPVLETVGSDVTTPSELALAGLAITTPELPVAGLDTSSGTGRCHGIQRHHFLKHDDGLAAAHSTLPVPVSGAPECAIRCVKQADCVAIMYNDATNKCALMYFVETRVPCLPEHLCYYSAEIYPGLP